MAELLQIKDLKVSVEDKQILKGIDLTINKGEIHVVMGTNGAGKSTLANAIMGNSTYTVDSGSIIFDGKDITEDAVNDRAKAGIFMSFQHPISIPGITVENFIRTAKSTITGKNVRALSFKKELKEKMDELSFDTSYAQRYVNEGFSGGERKKNEILQMSILNPKLAILDETDSGLDVDAVRIVSEGVQRFHNEENAVLIITHHNQILQKMEERKKTQVADMDRGVYDIKNDFEYSYIADAGLTEDIIREIWSNKNEPEWMLEFRLKSLEIYNRMGIPNWIPDISGLDMANIHTYVKPKVDMKENWDEVPEEIKSTFDRLGIPEAEKTSLAGVGAQYDSEVVYHSIQEDLVKQGVIYTDIETALHEHEEIVKKYWMTLIPPTDHKWAALHGAVWSGGSFVYVPAGVQVDIPLQSYFRLNAPGAGQFEHTMIIVEEGAKLHFIEGCSAPKYDVSNLHAGAVELFVKDNATLRYSTIENWSKNMYNLNTKRCVVGKGGTIEWVSGSFGSKVSCLYPMSILNGEGAHAEFTGVTFAGEGQFLDTGCKVVHNAPYTTSNVNSKSISKSGGAAIYRGLLKIGPNAEHSKATVSCESLMLDAESQSDTIPAIIVENDNVDLGHEAKIGRISDEAIFYLMTRGISEEEARAMLVRGFVEPISKELPLEYAVEMNNLINLELEGSIG